MHFLSGIAGRSCRRISASLAYLLGCNLHWPVSSVGIRAESPCLYCSSPCFVMSWPHDLVLNQALLMDGKVVSSYFAVLNNAALNIFQNILSGINIE